MSIVKSRLLSSTIILIRQFDERSPILTFEKSWIRAGGNLFGNNFLQEILSKSEITTQQTSQNNKINISCSNGIWIVGGDKDPNFLLYLWKKGRGDCFDFLLPRSEVVQLKSFYSKHNFDFMLQDISTAEKKYMNENPNTLWCVII